MRLPIFGIAENRGALAEVVLDVAGLALARA